MSTLGPRELQPTLGSDLAGTLSDQEEAREPMTNAAEEDVVRSNHVGEAHRVGLFPARTVPSFINIAGAKAAAEYYTVRQSLDDQELRRAARRSANVLDRQ